jgi:hypothetical protein
MTMKKAKSKAETKNPKVKDLAPKSTDKQVKGGVVGPCSRSKK